MISVTTDMIFRAVVASSILGVISGIIHALLRAISSFFVALFLRLLKGKIKSFKQGVFSNMFDFIFVFAVGVAYVLILYAFTDGVFYLITLAALFMSFFAVNSIVLSISKMRKR